MNELEMLAYLIADEMIDSVDSRLTRAFDRLMAPEEADTNLFAMDFHAMHTASQTLAHTARA